MSTDPVPAVTGIQADDLPPSARAMIDLLSASLERQARIAEQNNDRVGALGDRVDAMGEKVSAEIGAAMRHQTKVLSALVLISLVLLGGAAGVSFMGDGFGVSIGTDTVRAEESLDSVATPDEDSTVIRVEDLPTDPLDERGMASVDSPALETGQGTID